MPDGHPPHDSIATVAAQSKKSQRAHALRALQIAGSVALLTWVVMRVDLDAVGRLVGHIDAATWALGVAFVLAAPLVAAERTRTLFRVAGFDAPWRAVLAMNLEAIFFSVVLPGDVVSGVVRWARINKRLASGSGALALMLVERFIDWFALGVSACAGAWFLFDGRDAQVERCIVATAGASLAAGAGGVLLAARSAYLRGRVDAAPARFTREWAKRLATGFASTLEGISRATRDPAATRRIAFASAAYWIMAWTGGVLIARAVQPTIPPLSVVGASAAIGVLSQLPLTFAGLGLREASLPVLLAAYGVTREIGLLLGLSMFAPALILAVVGGVLHALGKAEV